jgi:hypothetical protein
VTSFEHDRAWEAWCRDKVLAPFHATCSHQGRFVFIDKSRCSTIMQKRFEVDTVVQRRGGTGSYMIEEKMTRAPKGGGQFPSFCLETQSCTVPGRESDGWMIYGEADYLLYGFQRQHGADDVWMDDLRAWSCTRFRLYLIDFQALKKWFWPRVESFHLHVMPKTLNRTAMRLVPISAVEDGVGFRVFDVPLIIPAERAA